MSVSTTPSGKSVYWQQVLDEYSQSGLTVKQFCAERSISIPSFYLWKRKLSTPVPTNTMVPVKLIGRIEPVPPSHCVQIFTPAGFTVRFESTMPSDELMRVLHAIEDSSKRGST
jgi:hypothetical protein